MTKAFRLLIILYWIFAVLGVTVDELTRDGLPPELREYVTAYLKAGWSSRDIFLALVGIPSFIAYVISTIGLYKLKHWSRLLYTISLLIFIPLSLIDEPSVSTQLSEALTYIGTLVNGGILAMAYFSPLSAHFQRAHA